MSMIVKLLLLVIVFVTEVICATSPRPLYVLSLLPYSDSNGTYGWDKGLELLPAARVAVRHVNSRNDVLPGYTIKLIERASDACGRSVITKGLQNFVGNALKPFNTETNAIAVVGLACSTVTATVAPIASGFDLLQLVIANSDLLRNKQKFPHTWRLISSSNVVVEATIQLMEKFGWERVGLVSDANGFFFQALAESFREAIKLRNFTLVVDEGIDSSLATISSAIQRIQNEGVRIIFAPTTLPESVQIMCQAAKRNLNWPGYVWIFPSRSYSDFTINTTTALCDKLLLKKVLENVTLVDFELNGRNDSEMLVSGITYSEYRSQYEVEYENVREQYKNVAFSSTYNVYANAMYDEVWTLALALNSSLQELRENNFYLHEYRHSMPEITKIIEKNLRNVSFSGALTNVRFNDYNEVPTTVNVFQVRDRSTVQIGFYTDKNLVILNVDKQNIPGDDFVREYNYLSIGFAVELYINAIVLLVITSLLMTISLLLRKEPEILAISPLLSILIFIGCYLLIATSILTTSLNSTKNIPSSVYVAMCYFLDSFAHIGINLIATTILVRLIRVYRIFTHFGKTSKFWHDKYLFFVTVSISLVPELMTVIGSIVDPLEVIENKEYLNTKNPPVIFITQECRSAHGFSNISYIIKQIYAAFLILFLLAFAVLTRKVNKKNFKDTKKITLFIFSFTIIATVSEVLTYLFESSNRRNVAVLLASYSHQLIVLLCLAILIMPKAIPAFYYSVCKKQKRSFHTEAARNTTISKLVMNSIQNYKNEVCKQNATLFDSTSSKMSINLQ